MSLPRSKDSVAKSSRSGSILPQTWSHSRSGVGGGFRLPCLGPVLMV